MHVNGPHMSHIDPGGRVSNTATLWRERPRRYGPWCCSSVGQTRGYRHLHTVFEDRQPPKTEAWAEATEQQAWASVCPFDAWKRGNAESCRRTCLLSRRSSSPDEGSVISQPYSTASASCMTRMHYMRISGSQRDWYLKMCLCNIEPACRLLRV